jgi:hypothetical protein
VFGAVRKVEIGQMTLAGRLGSFRFGASLLIPGSGTAWMASASPAHADSAQRKLSIRWRIARPMLESTARGA